MCFGGGSSTPQKQEIPPPKPPTTFDYNVANRGDQHKAVARANAADPSAKSGPSFGSELGGTPQTNGGQ